MRILVAPDKFKGSLSARGVGEAIRAGLLDALPLAEVRVLPLADGGEGFAEVLGEALGMRRVECAARDALGRPCSGWYFAAAGGDCPAAALEMSVVNGLAMLQPGERDPFRAGTCGTGMLIRDAVARGARRVTVGIGGSATNDAGAGAAAALGVEFVTADGALVEPRPENFLRLAGIRGRAGCLDGVELVVASDVDNPLLGERGATRVYGPQKGLAGARVGEMERALAHLVRLTPGGERLARVPGAGASGGLGFGLMAFAGGDIRSGFDIISGALELEAAVLAADLVIGAEGHLDRQSAMGKAPARLRELAREHGKPTLAVAGRVSERAGFDSVLSLKTVAESEADSIRNAGRHIRRLVADWARRNL